MLLIESVDSDYEYSYMHVISMSCQLLVGIPSRNTCIMPTNSGVGIRYIYGITCRHTTRNTTRVHVHVHVHVHM